MNIERGHLLACYVVIYPSPSSPLSLSLFFDLLLVVSLVSILILIPISPTDPLMGRAS